MQAKTKVDVGSQPAKFNSVLGTVRLVAGQACIVSYPNETGHLIYGPYELRAPGRYRVEFDIALGDYPAERKGDPICAHLDVSSGQGASVISILYLKKSELSSEMHMFSLEFTLQEPRELEYRVWSNGQAGLIVSGSPRVTKLPDVTTSPLLKDSLERRWYNEREFLDGYLRNITGILHVGANIGQERRYYRLLGVDVIWVDPIHEVYDKLLDNIAGLHRQRAYKALLTDKEGEAYKFKIANNGGASSSILSFEDHAKLFPNIQYVEERTLKSTTLKGLMQREKISTEHYQALTLDVEGAELMVLRGAGELLGEFQYIKCEVADFPSRVGSPNGADLDEMLVPFGFEQLIRRPFAYGPGGNGTYWDIVWKKRPATGPLHLPGVHLPIIASSDDTYGWDKVG